MVLIITALVMGEVLALAPDLLKGNQMVASVFELLDRKTQVVGDTGEELSNVEGTIELKGVHFSYPSRPDVAIFSDFDLKVPSGKSMALVGQSGSGKSSVLSLILRFYDPTAGTIMIDGECQVLDRNYFYHKNLTAGLLHHKKFVIWLSKLVIFFFTHNYYRTRHQET